MRAAVATPCVSHPSRASMRPRLPLDDLEIQHRNRVEHRHQDQRDHRGHREPADLRITERFPQGPAMQGERNERERRAKSSAS